MQLTFFNMKYGNCYDQAMRNGTNSSDLLVTFSVFIEIGNHSNVHFEPVARGELKNKEVTIPIFSYI